MQSEFVESSFVSCIVDTLSEMFKEFLSILFCILVA